MNITLHYILSNIFNIQHYELLYAIPISTYKNEKKLFTSIKLTESDKKPILSLWLNNRN
jgi:hypothetical protein